MKTTLRIAALLALSFFAISETAPAQSTSQPATTIVVLATHQTQKRLWPVLVSTLRRDAAAAAASQSAPIDGNPQIILGGGDIPGPAFPSRIEVELLGPCDDPWDAGPPAKNGPLGYVRKDAGIIAPVIYVDCAQINQLMGHGTRNMTENQRLSYTSEAISHVILHEWIHIATQSPAHTSRGIMQSALSLHELTTPVADARTVPAKTRNSSQNASGNAGVIAVKGFTLLIGDQR
jgi:hypothetical protein